MEFTVVVENTLNGVQLEFDSPLELMIALKKVIQCYFCYVSI